MIDPTNETKSEREAIAEDSKILESMGYRQELRRAMSGFANFSLSFSIICILAGGVTSFHLGFCGAGGASIGLGWPLFSAFSLIVALTMGQVASAFPSAGGLYHWSSILGGKFWGWLTAWLNLAGLVAVASAINVGAYEFFLSSFGPLIGFEPQTWGEGSRIVAQTIAMSLITFSQAALNHQGIRLTARLVEFSGYWLLIFSAVLTIALLAAAPSWDVARLWTATNFTGESGGGVWPSHAGLAWAFALSLMLPAYTMTGFDASAHAAEETIGAARSVPRGIVQSVLISGLAGWAMLSAAVLAMPSIESAAAQGAKALPWTMGQVLPTPMAYAMFGAILIAQYFCGLSTIASLSRMTYAFARDGGFIASDWLRQVDPRTQVPARSVWTVSAVAVLFTIYVPVYSTITAVSVLFLYLSYVMPAVPGCFAYGRSWTKMGPWSLGRWYRPLALISVAGCVGLFVIATQPPNDRSAWVVAGTVLALVGSWFAWEKRRFPGPPVGVKG